MTRWQSEHWLEELSGEFPANFWLCSCGASGSARTQLQAGSEFRRHFAEATEGAA